MPLFDIDAIIFDVISLIFFIADAFIAFFLRFLLHFFFIAFIFLFSSPFSDIALIHISLLFLSSVAD